MFDKTRRFCNRIDAYYAFDFARLLGEFGLRWEASDVITIVDAQHPAQSLHYRVFKFYATKKQENEFKRIVKVRHIQHYFV